MIRPKRVVIETDGFECDVCGKDWPARAKRKPGEVPVQCPRCGSKWNTVRGRKPGHPRKPVESLAVVSKAG
jgi:hypothetical protein